MSNNCKKKDCSCGGKCHKKIEEGNGGSIFRDFCRGDFIWGTSDESAEKALKSRAKVAEQSNEAKEKEKEFMEKASALAQAHGGSAEFTVTGDGKNQAEFDIPVENEAAFEQELAVMVALIFGYDVTDEEDENDDGL